MNPYLFSSWRKVWISTALDFDSHHHRSDRRSGNGSPHGCGDGQGSARSDPGRVRYPGDVLRVVRIWLSRLGKHRRRIRRTGVRHGIVWHQQVLRGAHRCLPGVDRCRSQFIQALRAHSDPVLAAVYPVSAFRAHPDWHAAIHDTFVPQIIRSSDYLIMVVGLIGTTITPWMQFYLQASIVEKGIGKKQYSLAKWDVISGCIITDVIAFFVVLACAATLYVSGVRNISDATEAAVALRPLAGDFAYLLFALGLVNAAMLSAAILPLATAYNICEGLGAESGVNKRFSEAPVFYWLYTFLIVSGAGVVLIPRLPLIKLILFSQVANGALLPFLLVFMLLLVNRKKLMGEYTNSRPANVIAWATSIIIMVLTIAMIWTTSVGQ